MSDSIRIDKWLWTMRFYKTRSLATDACKKELIAVNGNIVKSSKEIKLEDLVTIDYRHYKHSFKIVKLTGNRVSAKALTDYMLDVTPEEEIRKREAYKVHQLSSHHTKTKPEKHDRKQIKGFLEG